MRHKLGWLGLFLATIGLSIWSYLLVDRNLTLISWLPYQNWQATLWKAAESSGTVVWFYIFLIGLYSLSYTFLFLFPDKAEKKTTQNIWIMWGIVALIFFMGHNAVSHDIFNYLFNAKMVLLYQADPHQMTALDFNYDPWLRFMHNVHTPAPYGWGWTLLSLIAFLPFLIIPSFLIAYFSMKLFMALGLVLYLGAVWQLLKTYFPQQKWQRWCWLAFNPLLLLETLQTGHNDVWMMAPVLGVFLLLSRKKYTWRSFLLSAALLIISVSIKYASIVLLPVLLLVWWDRHGRSVLGKHLAGLTQLLNLFAPYWAELAVAALIIPLFTARSQQFHPWYLIWALSFLPFVRWRGVQALLIGLSVSSLLRYIPWILANLQYNDQVQWQMRAITWSGAIIGITVWLVLRFIRVRK